VAENPLVIHSLMQVFGLTGLALEWHEDLAPVTEAFLAGGPLADNPLLWFGDGRITAGHLAVLRERAAAGPLTLTLFDGTMDPGWSWSERDEPMASRILAAPATGTLVVAGNAHTPTTRTDLGMPLGAHLARQRPGMQEIRISYGSGQCYNIEPLRGHQRLCPQCHRAVGLTADRLPDRPWRVSIRAWLMWARQPFRELSSDCESGSERNQSGISDSRLREFSAIIAL
jgi:hypothetical protein